jgi:phage repressor protein C with HTH and peptisase S24 domain
MEFTEKMATLLKALGMNANEFARALDYKAPEKIYALLKGKNRPGYDTLNDILRAFPQLNADWLIREESTGPMFLEVQEQSQELNLYRTMEEWEEKKMIPLVDKQAYASWIEGFSNVERESLMHLYLSDLVPGNSYVAVRIYGDSMHPTIADNDIVVTSLLHNFFEIRNQHLYVVVTNDSIFCKRVVNLGKKLQLISDNPAHPAFTVETEEVRSLWEVKRRITAFLNIPANVEQRIMETEKNTYFLEQELHKIQRELQEVKKQIPAT